jgi:hypothetical protein
MEIRTMVRGKKTTEEERHILERLLKETEVYRASSSSREPSLVGWPLQLALAHVGHAAYHPAHFYCQEALCLIGADERSIIKTMMDLWRHATAKNRSLDEMLVPNSVFIELFLRQ